MHDRSSHVHLPSLAAPFARRSLGSFLCAAFLAPATFLMPAAFLAPAAAQSSLESSPSGENASKSDEVARWIDRLGSENYSDRLQAQSELERIGVRALDQLHQACFHADPQIASQARFMVQSNQFNWAWDSDRFNVRRILQNYSNAELHDKTVFIDTLFRLENDEGIAPLCRLVRYEPQGCLAKHAALRLMLSNPQFGQSTDERNKMIYELLAGANSAAGQWVQLATQPHAESFPIDRWESWIDAEKQLLLNHSMDTSIGVVTALRRWVAEKAGAFPDLRERALNIGRSIQTPFLENADPVSPNAIVAEARYLRSPFNMPPLEFATWANSAKLPELVQEQHAKLDPVAALTNANYSYLLAESLLVQGFPERAEAAAELASQRIPLQADGTRRTDGDKRPNNPLLDSIVFRSSSASLERSSIANELIERGRFDWAERELRIALKGHEDSPEAFPTTLGLSQLSDLLHEQGRDEEAASVLKPFTDRYESEPLFKNQVADQFGQALPSNYYLYLGDHYARTNEPEKARESYLKCIERSNENVDALIGLFQLPENEEQRTQRLAIQDRVISELRSEIESIERELRHVNARMLNTEQNTLANSMNTLAWLLTQTRTRPEEALFLSRKACSLSPKAAYFDTLAHCYSTLGNVEDAIKYQRRAVELEPFKPSLNKALKKFEAQAQTKKQ